MPAAGSAGEYEWQSYRQVSQQVEALARAMARAGAGRGGRVGVYGVGSPEWATVRAGLIQTLIACCR